VCFSFLSEAIGAIISLCVLSEGSLKEVYEFHINQHRRESEKVQVSKELRNYFVEGTLDEISEKFQELVGYCALDVKFTHEVSFYFFIHLLFSLKFILKPCKLLFALQIHHVLFPEYQNKCPHPVTFAGMLEMGSCYLPTSKAWDNYVEKSSQAFEGATGRIDSLLLHLAQKAVNEGPEVAKVLDYLPFCFLVFVFLFSLVFSCFTCFVFCFLDSPACFVTE